MRKKDKISLLRILLSSALLLLAVVFADKVHYPVFLFIIPYVTVGYDIIVRAVRGIISLQPFDENFLMALATVGAFVLGERAEGVFVMLFYQIGELFQSLAVEKSRRSISALMDIRPDLAHLVTDEGEVTLSPDEIETGSIILVKVGEKIPIDGVVIWGESRLDTHALTGESVPVRIRAGERAVSGSVNLSSTLKIKTDRSYEDSTVIKILELVEGAAHKKAKAESFISKFARVYTPIVCAAAVALAVLVPLLRAALSLPPDISVWVYRALTFLVISCPCALVISVPLTFFSGIGGASREGILIKGSTYIDALSRVRTVVFDKTGTVTKGEFKVIRQIPVNAAAEHLVMTAAYAEHYSNHPISACIRQLYREEVDEKIISEASELHGMGISARVNGTPIYAGNSELMRAVGISFPKLDEPYTAVHIAEGDKYLGALIIGDEIKESSAEAISELFELGIHNTVMLSGDREDTVRSVAGAVGIQKYHHSLLPDRKLSLLEEIIAEADAPVAFCGDGINDAPALARADVGISMGAIGQDSAIEASDIVIMNDEPKKIAKAIKISRKSMRIVRENIGFAIGVKVLCLVLGAMGIASLWISVFADVGVMVLAVLNAMRALKTKNL